MPPSVAGFTLAQMFPLATKKTHFEQCKMQFSGGCCSKTTWPRAGSR
jgi:hypothetical protein